MVDGVLAANRVSAADAPAVRTRLQAALTGEAEQVGEPEAPRRLTPTAAPPAPPRVQHCRAMTTRRIISVRLARQRAARRREGAPRVPVPRRVRRRAGAGVPGDAGRQRGEGQRRRHRDQARVVGPARLLRPARAAARHGHRRRRRRGPLLRGERVPLPLPARRPARPRRPARSTTRCTTSRRPIRAGSIVTYQVPIHDIDLAVGGDRARRGDGWEVAAAPGVPRRARPARLLPRALRPHVGGDLRPRAAGVLPHRAQHRARPARRPRPTPRLAWTLSCMPPSACEALGMWLLTGILTRYPELKVVFVEPGLGMGRGLPVVPRRHGAAPGLRVPGARRASCRASTTTATWR